jgi:RNA polymerase sigma factor (sigma-70 family)
VPVPTRIRSHELPPLRERGGGERCNAPVVPDPREERELVLRAQDGDVAAFETLVAAYQQLAFRTAYVVAGNAADAEDAAQEAFVKAHAALARFDAARPLRPWLLRIVANEARNRRRSAGRRAHLATRAAREPGTPVPGAEESVIAVERDTELRSALAALRESDRQVIFLRYFLDLSEAETATALGCRQGTVKSRLSRGLERLRNELEAAGG